MLIGFILGVGAGLLLGLLIAAVVNQDHNARLYKAFCKKCQAEHKRSEIFCEIACEIYDIMHEK